MKKDYEGKKVSYRSRNNGRVKKAKARAEPAPTRSANLESKGERGRGNTGVLFRRQKVKNAEKHKELDRLKEDWPGADVSQVSK